MKHLALFLALLWGSVALAQTSNVTATITDSDGTVWANGSFSVTFVPPVGNSTPPVWNGVLMTTAQKGPYVGTMNGSGAMAVSLPDNSFISPPGSMWAFTICPLATAKCTIITIPVVGASPNFTATFSAAVSPPRFAATGVGAYGYADVEISVVPVPGGQYYSVTSACMRIWSGSAWSCLGGGGGGVPGGSPGQLQVNNAGAFAGLTDLTFTSPHTIVLGASGILNITGTFQENGAAGSSTQVLHGNGAGFSAVLLTTDVTGTLPLTSGGTGSATAIGGSNNLACPNSGGGATKGDTDFYSGVAGTGWQCFAGNNSGTQVYSQNSTGTPAWFPLQGTDTKIMTAGTISGTGAALCTDALLGATTVGCSTGSGPGAPTFSTQVNNGSGGFQGVGPGITGQGLQAFNAAAPAFVSPGIPGTSVSTTPYIVQCDSATTQIDRLTTIEFFSGASVITMPDPTTSGCGANFSIVSLADVTGGTLTINRTTTATFTVLTGFSVVTGATSFNLTNGQFAALSSPDNATWLVRLTNGGAGGTPAFPITVTGGVSGGIPCFTSTTVESASALLTQFGVVFGGGASVCPTSSAQGGVNFPLIGQGAANPIFSTIGYPTSLASGGILYGLSTTQLASSALLPTGDFVLGGGLGGAPTATFSVVPTANGGSGTGGALTGIVRGGSPFTASELSGDCATSGSNAVTCTKVNGGTIPLSAFLVGTNASRQFVALPTITAIQGTDTKLLSSSSVSASTGIVLCTDSVGGATTSGCPAFVANTTTTVGTSAIGANTCNTVTNLTMAGVTTSMVAEFTPTTDVSGVTGWGSTGGLVIDAWPSAANTISYKTCNQTSASITPSSSVVFNVGAR